MNRQRIALGIGVLGVGVLGIGLLILAFWIGWTGGSGNSRIAQQRPQLIISAAASLTESLHHLAPLYQRSNPKVLVRFNFGSSGGLLQQIRNGAPVDIFISAAAPQMDTLQTENFLLANTRRNLLTNQLVLVVPTHGSKLNVLTQLTEPRIKRIAIGDPRIVPAGAYTQQALTKVGLWNQLQSKLVLTQNVRQVLRFVEARDADAGFIYLTDAQLTDRVKIVQTIPSDLHDPIVYAIAILKNSRNPSAAKNFVQFLESDLAQKVFQSYGFQGS
jgi:molybdate transport system substrate-binding protein